MPKYFCEYCGIYLTNSSPRSRKQHAHGRKHINNKIEYYSQFLYEFQHEAYKSLMSMASKMTNTSTGQGPSSKMMVMPGQNILVHPIRPQNLVVSQMPSSVVNYLPQ